MIPFIIWCIFFYIAYKDIKTYTISTLAILVIMSLSVYAYYMKYVTVTFVLLHGFYVLIGLLVFRFLMNQAFQKETFGLGDVYLLTSIALYKGDAYTAMQSLLIGAYIALIVMLLKKKQMLPFGPFIILGLGLIELYDIFIR